MRLVNSRQVGRTSISFTYIKRWSLLSYWQSPRRVRAESSSGEI